MQANYRPSSHWNCSSFSALVVTAAAALHLLTGCTEGPQPAEEKTAEEIVSERAQQRWNALLAGDLKGAYEFTSPAYRSSTTQERYAARFGAAVQWISAEVEAVKCEQSRCSAIIELTYRAVRQDMENARQLEETWVYSEGQWWLHQGR